MLICDPDQDSSERAGEIMGTMSKKLSVGIAGCAIAAAATLTPMAPAEAAPAMPAPAAPVFSGPAPVWGGGGSWFGFFQRDLLKPVFKPSVFSSFHFFQWGCYG